MGAYITVSDASGRVLFRRPATDAEVMSALAAAQTCEIEAHAAIDRIAQERSVEETAEAANAAEAADMAKVPAAGEAAAGG